MAQLMADTVIIGADHAGYELKQVLIPFLEKLGLAVVDMGPSTGKSCDYPVSAKLVCDKVLADSCAMGILICGTGIGMSIAANRFHGIRAALCTHEYHAKATRMHNNANVLCLGGRVTAVALASDLAQLFFTTSFEKGRHVQRIELLDSPR